MLLDLDVPLRDVERPLVLAGVIAALPKDEWINLSRYYSNDGKSYGLLVGKNPPCLVEVNASNTNWWGPPTICREF